MDHIIQAKIKSYQNRVIRYKLFRSRSYYRLENIKHQNDLVSSVIIVYCYNEPGSYPAFKLFCRALDCFMTFNLRHTVKNVGDIGVHVWLRMAFYQVILLIHFKLSKAHEI